ncbi:hypothetical protein VN12_25150 [Pirellula sp. SH-Sr6A]|nr:hypothetical protein VN12_25150 [Pirellula sp. SH-Sr6A]
MEHHTDADENWTTNALRTASETLIKELQLAADRSAVDRWAEGGPDRATCGHGSEALVSRST